MAARVNPQPGEVLIDLAGGTGDIARRLKARGDAVAKRRGGQPPTVTIIDINEEMIRAGRARGEDGLSWLVGDAEALPVPDRFADAYTIAFGIRNVTDIPKALREARRALKPGGRFACLEFSKPTTGALEAVYDLWSFKAIPPIGKLVTGDAQPYQYLVESIRRFPDQDTFAQMVRDAGFRNVGYTNFAGGIVALHTGWAL
jgi:demethylmenaquinone methyltransferase/2-methoxy-6-polyprenyl-1,4-benzoquinol methylase